MATTLSKDEGHKKLIRKVQGLWTNKLPNEGNNMKSSICCMWTATVLTFDLLNFWTAEGYWFRTA